MLLGTSTVAKPQSHAEEIHRAIVDRSAEHRRHIFARWTYGLVIRLALDYLSPQISWKLFESS